MAETFAERMVDIYTGSMLTNMLDIGYRTGLLEAAAKGPATSAELAARASLDERYVREWLGAMATGGIFTYDAEAKAYTLPDDHAAMLTGDGASNVAPVSGILNHFTKHVPKLVEAFRHGGGVPYEDYWPEFTCCSSDVWRRIFDEKLVDGFLGAVPGLNDQLAAGIDVLDVGCGDGHAINVMAEAFPASRFHGYDITTAGLESAAAEAKRMGLANTNFAHVDVTALPTEPKFDVITAFDSIHDQFAPDVVLRKIREALADDGTFLMIDFKFATDVAGNIGNRFAPIHYGISVMHCMTVSLAQGGAGLGTVWGIEKACEMLDEAGFGDVQVVDSPRPQNCIYICKA
jgi:2-polyprenyl-3-methyl-5-hydroxy-6-metoxy-1,4-benzoquinol methylase